MMRSLGVRTFSTENETSAESSTQDKQKDDYNLDEVTPQPEAEKPATQKKPHGQRRDQDGRRQAFDRRQQTSTGGGNLFKKQESQQPKGITFEEYSQTLSFKQQQEIFNMIKDKIGASQDKSKVQHFYDSLKNQSIKGTKYMSEITLAKVKALIEEQKVLDDKEFFQKPDGNKPFVNVRAYSQEGEFYPQSFSSRQEEIRTAHEYEQELRQQIDAAVHEQYLNTGVSMHNWEEDLQESDRYQRGQEIDYNEPEMSNELMKFIREELLAAHREKSPFEIDRVTKDLAGYQEKMTHEHFMKEVAAGRFQDNDNQLLNQFTPNQIEAQKESQGWTEKDDKDFEDAMYQLQGDVIRHLRDDFRGEYDQLRTSMKLNQQLKRQAMFLFKQNKNLLSNLRTDRIRLLRQLERESADISSTGDLAPMKAYDFIKLNRVNENRAKFIEKYKQRDFNHQSKITDDYIKEFEFLVNAYYGTASKSIKNQVVTKMGYLANLVMKNDISVDGHLNAKLFEYAALNGNHEYANQLLKHNLNGQTPSLYNNINLDVLEHFFNNSLKHNNFNGLGFLVNYLEKYQVPIENWDMSRFASALNFYLNQSFNLNNVLTFCRFNVHYHQSRLNHHLRSFPSTLSESQKFDLHSRVFTDSLVDMKSLFGYLVNKVGEKSVVDPFSKQDPLWTLIEFYKGNSKVQEIENYGTTTFNTISDEDVVKYFKAQGLNNFERITQVLLCSQNNEHLHNLTIQALKEYQANNQNMPLSFSSSKLRNVYLKMKTLSDKNQLADVNVKTLEYFLYLFKANSMWPELLDLLENLEKFTGGKANVSQIKNYYLSEQLLSLPSDRHYYQLLQDAVFQNQDESNSACFITQMTKAYMKDGSIEHGLKFFENKITGLKELKQMREDFLISLFDSTYGQENAEQVSYEDFKSKYVQSMRLSSQVAKESFVVSQLHRLTFERDYDDIETMFQLYLVKQEKSQLLADLPDGQQYQALDTVPLDYLDEDLRERINNLDIRIKALSSKLTQDDVRALTEIAQIQKGNQIKILNEDLNGKSADDLQKMFGLISKDQINEILEKTSRFDQVLSKIDQDSAAIKKVTDKVNSNVEKALKENMKDMIFERDFPEKRMKNIIDPHYERKRPNYAAIERTLEDFKMYNKYVYHAPIADEKDPELVKKTVHDSTLLQMKEELLQAVNNRRAKVLQISLNIFNKLQSQTVKTLKLNSVIEQADQTDEGHVDSSKISENVQKLDILLNNPRSPIFSALQNLAQYKGDKDVKSFNKMFNDLKSYFRGKLAIDEIRNETHQLQGLTSDLEKTHKLMKAMQSHIQKQIQSQQNKKYHQWNDEKNEQMAQVLEHRIKKLFEQFKAQGGKKGEQFSRETKLSLLRDVLSVEYGDQFAGTNSIFPSFYCQDLIVFGIENNIPEAVRLGEKMMSENGYVLSRDLQVAVKNYLLENQEEYRKAIKKTGPIDNTSLYRSVKSQRDSNDQPVIFSMDDPYWVEFFDKNKKRQHQWKTPSMMAWDHKEMGMLGEIFDAKKLNDVHKQLKSFII